MIWLLYGGTQSSPGCFSPLGILQPLLSFLFAAQLASTSLICFPFCVQCNALQRPSYCFLVLLLVTFVWRNWKALPTSPSFLAEIRLLPTCLPFVRATFLQIPTEILFTSLPVVDFLGIITSEGAFSMSRVLLQTVPDSPLRQSIPCVVVLLFNVKASFSTVWRLSLVQHETLSNSGSCIMVNSLFHAWLISPPHLLTLALWCPSQYPHFCLFLANTLVLLPRNFSSNRK